ncbi:MAG: hypothetical protein HC905_26290 [Bacteroidales bacterium]|nr:hypothetical protein [Bacteroidales bacterium]
MPKQVESYLNDTSSNIILNKDFKIRDSILDIHVNWDTISGGIAYYEDLDITNFTELLKHKFIDPNEYQNESPTVRRFYYFMTKYPSCLFRTN